MDWIFEIKIRYWKHEKAFGNLTRILETYVLYWKHKNAYENNAYYLYDIRVRVYFG